MTSYLISRTLAAGLLGWVFGLGLQRNAFVAALAGFSISMVAQICMLFLGSHHGPVIPFLTGTLITSMYDGVIATLVFVLFSRFGGSRQKDRYSL